MPAVQETGPRTAAASRRRAIDPPLRDPSPRWRRDPCHPVVRSRRLAPDAGPASLIVARGSGQPPGAVSLTERG